MRTVILLGLMAIANSISLTANKEDASFYTTVFIIVAFMDLLDFIKGFDDKQNIIINNEKQKKDEQD